MCGSSQDSDTTEGVLGRPSILPRESASSPSGADGGAILVRRVNPSSYAADLRTRRQLSVGLEPARWCPRTTWDVRGRDDFGEGSSSRRNWTTKRGGSASRTPQGVAVPHARVRLQQPPRWLLGTEGASRSDQPKRAQANSSAPPLGFRPRERLWSSKGSHSERRSRWKNARERAPRSPCSALRR